MVERPDHVFKFIWAEILVAAIGDIDSTTFTASGTFYSTNSYTFSLLIANPIQADELLMKLALQCRSRFFVSPQGTAKLIVRQLSQGSVHAITKNEIKRDSMSIIRSSTKDLINLCNIHYDLNHSHQSNEPKYFRAATRFTNSASVTKYGQKEWKGAKDMFLFDAVTTDAMALDVGTFLLSYHSTVRKMPRFSIFLDNMETEPGDIIDITHPLDNMDGFVCEVLKINHILGSGMRKIIDHIKITGLEN